MRGAMNQALDSSPEIELVYAAAAPPRPAGFWRRGVALLLDYVFLVLMIGVAGGLVTALWGESGRNPRVVNAAVTAFRWFLPPLYAVLFHWLWGQTMGKIVVGARVVTLEGGALSLPRAIGRTLAWVVAVLPLGLGLALAAARRDRRGLHDLLAGTRVERV
jgi:uncharacterized RDD family membrane protein YckC